MFFEPISIKHIFTPFLSNIFFIVSSLTHFEQAGLAVKQGDVVTVHGAPDFNGYVRAEKGGMSGLVPVDFLRNMNDQNFNPNFNQMPNQGLIVC